MRAMMSKITISTLTLSPTSPTFTCTHGIIRFLSCNYSHFHFHQHLSYRETLTHFLTTTHGSYNAPLCSIFLISASANPDLPVFPRKCPKSDLSAFSRGLRIHILQRKWSMFKGDDVYPTFFSSVRANRLQYDTDGIPLQLFGDSRFGCNIGSLNCKGGGQNPLMEIAKGGAEVGSLSRERKHPISLHNKSFQDNDGQSGYAPNVVSTGLRLSYEEDEPNSSVTFASKGIKVTLPIILSLDDNLKVEIDQQKKELDCYIKFQEENTIKGLSELRLRHMVSFLSAIERGVSRKLYEKEQEIENMNNKNQELLEKIKQVSMELQSWQYRAKYNESVVNTLKNNLRQVMVQCVMRGKEAHGDREIEEVASCTNTGYQGVPDPAGDLNSFKGQMNCRACQVKEVCVSMLPCRHLCLCKDCELFIDVCPVCGIMKTASVEVIMS